MMSIPSSRVIFISAIPTISLLSIQNTQLLQQKIQGADVWREQKPAGNLLSMADEIGADGHDVVRLAAEFRHGHRQNGPLHIHSKGRYRQLNINSRQAAQGIDNWEPGCRMSTSLPIASVRSISFARNSTAREKTSGFTVLARLMI